MKSRLLASVVGVCTVAGIREKAEEVKVRYFVEISPDPGTIGFVFAPSRAKPTSS